MQTNVIHHADCFDKLQELPENSIHACVCDPPYGLAFMSRSWDQFEPKEYQEWCEKWASEVKRVLKPGGHIVSFSGNRTYHRLGCGIEDAGFRFRDEIATFRQPLGKYNWAYGSGFPKSTDMSKAIDKRKDADRDEIGVYTAPDGTPREDMDVNIQSGSYADGHDREQAKNVKTAPATPEAKKWDGWKTGLKPAHEPIAVARKPFDGATVDCVQEHGTGALNIDGCRVEVSNGETLSQGSDGGESGSLETPRKRSSQSSAEKGRYPANVVFDELEAERLDQKEGIRDDGEYTPTGASDREATPFDPDDGWNDHSMKGNNKSAPDSYGGKGGPSRYFYTSKATKAERTLDGKITAKHPTQKPLDLMEWLVKMVTRENQIVIDPFAGTGTTLKACKNLNREFIGIEKLNTKERPWVDVARAKVGLTPENPSWVRPDEDQTGLEEYADD